MRANVVGGILEEYADHPETYEMPIDDLKNNPVGQKRRADRIKTEDMVELYCAIGKADCRDLDSGNPCVCPDCAVWEGNDLGAGYYCQQGSAQ